MSRENETALEITRHCCIKTKYLDSGHAYLKELSIVTVILLLQIPSRKQPVLYTRKKTESELRSFIFPRTLILQFTKLSNHG
jgi:hypothetical protein